MPARNEIKIPDLNPILRSAFVAAPSPICIKDTQLRFIYCNRRFEQLHGVEEADIVGKTSSEVLGEAGELDFSMDQKALLADRELHYDTVIVNAESELREFDVYKTPIQNEEKTSTIGLLCIYEDHTQLSRAERELSRSRVVMDSAKDAFLVVNREEMKIIDCNAEAEGALRRSREELLTLNPCSTTPQISESVLLKIFEKSEANKVEVVETLIMRKDGSVFDSEIQISSVESSFEDLFVLAIRDVSQRKRSESELKRANKTLRLIGSINRILISSSTECELMTRICDKIIESTSYNAVFALVGAPVGKAFASIYQNRKSTLDFITCLRGVGYSEEEANSILNQDLTEPSIRNALPRMEQKRGHLPSWVVPLFGSCLCLPTGDDKNLRVTLAIFAKENDAFDGSEIDLLKEMGEEISYGIRGLREKRAKKYAEKRIAKQLAIESAISRFSSNLLTSEALQSGIRKALPNLLTATDASQVFLYEINQSKAPNPIALRACEFKKRDKTSNAIAPTQIDLASELPRWLRLLENRRSIDSKAGNLPTEERRLFGFDSNARILIHPLYARNVWIGFLGINICEQANEQFEVKKEMLAMATDLLAEQYARYRTDMHMKMMASAINSSDEGVVISTYEESFEESRIVFANDGLCRITGYSKDNLIGLPATFIQSKKLSEEANQKLHADLDVRNAHTSEIVASRIDGSTFNCERRIYPIIGDDGNTSHYLCILRDITEHKKLESRVSFANKMESIGQLSAGIAHEINTPSQFIGDNLNFLQDAWEKLDPLIQGISENDLFDKIIADQEPYSKLTPKRLSRVISNIPDAISDANEGVERISTIVKAMREFSHPEKRMILSNINKCIKTTVTVARNEWKYVSELTSDLDDTLPPVECMPGDINQVLLNLIVNAAHAIEDKLDGAPGRGEINIRSSLVDDLVRISISDTGNGIPDEIRNAIFDPFFTTKEVGKGTGQGLFMAHSIIEQNHNGKLWFESVAGSGTTFHIDLPLSNPNSSESDQN